MSVKENPYRKKVKIFLHHFEWLLLIHRPPLKNESQQKKCIHNKAKLSVKENRSIKKNYFH